MTDEGCAPSLTTEICESPLSCMETGMMSWSTGALHYDLPPDIAPKVPFGPGIGMRRFYTSTSMPGVNPTSVNKKPLGDHWQHTYLTYLDRYLGGDSIYRVVLHTSDGRDVIFKYASTNSGWETFTPQAGFHVMSLKRNTVSPFQYQVQILTGEMLVYNSVGQISEVWDNLQPTPNKVLITWDSTSNGNVSTVTDANGKRRLQFSYASGLMTSVQFQTLASSVWTTRHTTTYDFNFAAGVSRDATSGWYVPASATEWTALLAGTGIANPGSLWGFQEASGNFADSISGVTLTATGFYYQQPVAGWSRKSILQLDTGGDFASNQTHAALPNLGTASQMTMTLQAIANTPSGLRGTTLFGSGGSYVTAEYDAASHYVLNDLTNTATGTVNHGTSVVPEVVRYNKTAGTSKIFVDAESFSPTFAALASGSKGVWFGIGLHPAPTINRLYAVAWYGASAELTDAQVADVIARIKNGPALKTVTVGGQVAQRMTYSSLGMLTKIADAASNQIATFAYSSTAMGQVDLVSTPRGTVGFEFGSTRSGCTGQTALYFNKGSAASCSIDSDCGAGMMCGGKTGTGSTGTCFLAARCLTLGTSFGESVVTTVTPIGAGGGSCSGACTDVAQYVWNTSPTNVIRAIGMQDPLGNFTSATYNSNGLPTQIAFGDTDSIPTNGGFQRTVYLSYDTVFPGRVKEIRRKSDIDPAAASCSAANSTGCAWTMYTFHPTTQLLQNVVDAGATLNSSGTSIRYSAQTNYTRESKGRITQIDGPVSPIKTTFAYFSSTDPFKDGFLSDFKAYKDATLYLQPTVLGYDFWGNPTGVTTPDGTVSCQTFDAARGFLSQRREAMAAQTDCATLNAADLTTSWTRDSALRVTQLTRPDGSCMFWEYDTSGRLARTKRRDDCLAASSGDREEYLYNSEGLLTEIDTYNASSTITRKQLMSYFASRRLSGITNPVDITKSTNLLYDAGGMVNEIDGAGALGKTTFAINADRRITGETRYKDAVNYDTWTLLFDWLGDQAKVTDGDAKATETIRDDAGRIVKIISPDMSYPTLRVYDAADRVTTVIEAFGGGTEQQTHTFTFDALSRPVDDNFSGACPTGTAHAEIMRTYDQIIDCPGGATGGCAKANGHLSKVLATLLCSSTYSDGSLDQTTWYGFDAGGRMVSEYVSDDTGRTANHLPAWSKSGALSQITTPAGAVLLWGFGSAGNNSDADRVSNVYRTNTSTPVIDTVKWFPYGPLQQYNWEATSGGTGLLTYITRNLAYRITYVGNAELSTLAGALDAVTITEDAKGRVTARDYAPSDPTFAGLYDSYFLYDQQDRVTCETTNFQSSCPSSGANLKNNQTGFTAAGDWQKLYRPIPGSTGLTNSFNPTGYGTSHQVTLVRQDDGTPMLGDTVMSYDARGNRKYDDNQSTLTHDRREYLYDGRRNVVNVRGEYKTGGVWHFYDVASAFDARNRRVYKSFYDETSTKTATWFFYYDPYDRLTEVRYTPDASTSSTYSVFQLFWLADRLTFYWQTDYPSVTTSKRYVATDEAGRPIKMWSWPTSGSTANVWAINPSAWGMDQNLVGPTVFQPLVFAGQYQDLETSAFQDDGSTIHRPGVALNGYRTYDVAAGSYLQFDPLAHATWSTYAYANSNPVGNIDPLGLMTDSGGCVSHSQYEGDVLEDYSEDDANCTESAGTGGSGGGGAGAGGGANGAGSGPGGNTAGPRKPRRPPMRKDDWDVVRPPRRPPVSKPPSNTSPFPFSCPDGTYECYRCPSGTCSSDQSGAIVVSTWSGEANCNACMGGCNLLSSISWEACSFAQRIDLGVSGHTGNGDNNVCNEPSSTLFTMCKNQCKSQGVCQ